MPLSGAWRTVPTRRAEVSAHAARVVQGLSASCEIRMQVNVPPAPRAVQEAHRAPVFLFPCKGLGLGCGCRCGHHDTLGDGALPARGWGGAVPRSLWWACVRRVTTGCSALKRSWVAWAQQVRDYLCRLQAQSLHVCSLTQCMPRCTITPSRIPGVHVSACAFTMHCMSVLLTCGRCRKLSLQLGTGSMCKPSTLKNSSLGRPSHPASISIMYMHTLVMIPHARGSTIDSAKLLSTLEHARYVHRMCRSGRLTADHVITLYSSWYCRVHL